MLPGLLPPFTGGSDASRHFPAPLKTNAKGQVVRRIPVTAVLFSFRVGWIACELVFFISVRAKPPSCRQCRGNWPRDPHK